MEDVVSWLKQNITFEESPVSGSTFISPDGKFVNLNSVGWDHFTFMNEMVERGLLDKSALDYEDVPGLQDQGWIRCNEGVVGDYPYIEFTQVQPTASQYHAVEAWIDYVLKSHKSVSVIWMTEQEYEEGEYSQLVMGSQVVKSVRKAYITGKLVPSSAFESLYKDTKKLSKDEILAKRKETFRKAGRG